MNGRPSIVSPYSRIEYDDYAEMCRYHADFPPQSHFTRARICSLATEEGRITLSDMRFITTSTNKEKQERKSNE